MDTSTGKAKTAFTLLLTHTHHSCKKRKMPTAKDPLLLQHGLTRIELVTQRRVSRSVSSTRSITSTARTQDKKEKYLLRGKDDLVSSGFSRYLVCVHYICNKNADVTLLQFHPFYPKDFIIKPSRQEINKKNLRLPHIHFTVCILGRIRKQSLEKEQRHIVRWARQVCGYNSVRYEGAGSLI